MSDSEAHSPDANAGTSRRSFLRTSAVLASGMAALAASLAPLRELTDYTSVEKFLQKHYKELSPQEMQRVLDRIEKVAGVFAVVFDLRKLNAEAVEAVRGGGPEEISREDLEKQGWSLPVYREVIAADAAAVDF